MQAGGDGDGPDADGAGAADVERSVADHPNRIEVHPAVELTSDHRQGFLGDVVALQVVISKSAEGKIFEQTVVTQFEACAVANITGKQAQGKLIAVGNILQKL